MKTVFSSWEWEVFASISHSKLNQPRLFHWWGSYRILYYTLFTSFIFTEVYSEPTVTLPPIPRHCILFIITIVHHLPSRSSVQEQLGTGPRRVGGWGDGGGETCWVCQHILKIPITMAHAVCDQFFRGGWTLWPHELIQIVFSTPIKSIPARIMTCFLPLCDFSPSFPTLSHWRIVQTFGISLISPSKQVFVLITNFLTFPMSEMQFSDISKTLLHIFFVIVICQEPYFLTIKTKTLFKCYYT